jgi:hypothetical protein
MPKKKIEATATAKRKVTIRPFSTSDRVNLGASGLRSSLILIMLTPSLAGCVHCRKVTWDIIAPPNSAWIQSENLEDNLKSYEILHTKKKGHGSGIWRWIPDITRMTLNRNPAV